MNCRVQYIPAKVPPAPDPTVEPKVFGSLEDIFILNNWTRQPTASTQDLQAVRYFPGAPYPYLCGGASSSGIAGDILVSKDASRWESQTNPVTEPINDYAWNGSAYVAVGGAASAGVNGLLLRSTDGITWTNQTPPATGAVLNSVIWSPIAGLFVAVGSIIGGSAVIWTSPTGVTWTSRTTANDAVLRVEAANGVIVAVGQHVTDARAQYSTDGVNWNAATFDNSAGYMLSGVAFGRNTWVACGGEDDFAYSLDNGATWTRGPTLPVFNETTGRARKVAFSGVVFALVGVASTGTNQGAVLASYEGRVWKPCSGVITSILDVAWGGNFWLVAGRAEQAESGSGYIATSLRK
jgi:hypothetical protein